MAWQTWWTGANNVNRGQAAYLALCLQDSLPQGTALTYGYWFYPLHGWVITSTVKCGIKLPIHYRTSTLQPSKFGMNKDVRPIFWRSCDYLSMLRLKWNHAGKGKCPDVGYSTRFGGKHTAMWIEALIECNRGQFYLTLRICNIYNNYNSIATEIRVVVNWCQNYFAGKQHCNI